MPMLITVQLRGEPHLLMALQQVVQQTFLQQHQLQQAAQLTLVYQTQG
jgi:hypothetical protein